MSCARKTRWGFWPPPKPRISSIIPLFLLQIACKVMPFGWHDRSNKLKHLSLFLPFPNCYDQKVALVKTSNGLLVWLTLCALHQTTNNYNPPKQSMYVAYLPPVPARRICHCCAAHAAYASCQPGRQPVTPEWPLDWAVITARLRQSRRCKAIAALPVAGRE